MTSDRLYRRKYKNRGDRIVFLESGYIYGTEWWFLNILIHIEGEMEIDFINKINEHKKSFSTHEWSFGQFSFPQITHIKD